MDYCSGGYQLGNLAGAFTSAAAGVTKFAASNLGSRFFYNPSGFASYSKNYWGRPQGVIQRKGAGNQFPGPQQLNHVIISRAAGDKLGISAFTNAGMNLMQIPWRANTWMGGIGVTKTKMNNLLRT